MHKREMVEAMLGKIEQAIERILDNSSYRFLSLLPCISRRDGTP